MDQIELSQEFKQFIDEHYLEELAEASRLSKKSLTIDFKELQRFCPELSDEIIDDPEQMLKKLSAEIGLEPELTIRIKNLTDTCQIPIRRIRSNHIDKLITIKGNVKNRTLVRPRVTKGKFECPSCGNIIELPPLENTMREPSACGCGRKGKFTLIDKEMMDAQFISVEEPFDEIGDDTVPQKMVVLMTHDLTDPELQNAFLPGKPIKITGVLKELPVIKGRQKTLDCDLYIEANHVESLENDLNKTNFTEDEIKNFKELAKAPDILDKLIKSFAPNISGHEKVKEACLLFLVKGTPKTDGEGKMTREFMHILLMGDPGTAKSQIGNEIKLLSWRAKKVVGKGASGVGLTASAERDEVLNMRVLQAGTIPLCNGGHVVTDEIDKMDPETTDNLLEAMEDGTIHVSKSTIQGKLNARTSVFTIGNPKYGRYDPNSPIHDQIALSKPLLNRFDLIFPIRDVPEESKDRTLANSILSRHFDIEKSSTRAIDLRIYKNYLCYAALNIKPKLTKESLKIFEDTFVKMRSQSNSGSIGITGRQLEGLVRLAEAYAKLRLSNEISVEDANKAVELTLYSLQAFGIDPDTGKIDIDRITSGVSASQRNKINQVKDIINDLEGRFGKEIPVDEIFVDAKAIGFKHKDVEKILDQLRRTGDIFEVRPGYYSKI